MSEIWIDGERHEAREGENLLHACLSLGLDLPYFCWHPALGSVGSCRQCAVKQFKGEDDEEGQLVMACMTPVEDGARLSIDDPEARDFRARVIEWLMVNHPHDCPVCDEGGECHLQDMTVMTGHAYRRHRFEKRTHLNQDLGPFIHHEMNRCIACYRCVRYYRDYAGGRDLDVFGAHDDVYFGRAEDGALESPFAGNLVEVCPTGVFTDKTLKRHYTRKWDLESAPSVCSHCAVGCNTLVGTHAGTVRRILDRYHPEVNRYFLCDRGRFGYGFVDSDDRLRRPLVRDGDVRDGGAELRPADGAEALRRAGELLREGRVLGVASPRASLATARHRAAPAGVALLAATIARELDPDAPELPDDAFDGTTLDDDTRKLAAEVASALRDAHRPLVVAGSTAGTAVMTAAGNLARALHRARGGAGNGGSDGNGDGPVHLAFTLPECNSLGLALAGGESLEAAFEAAERGEVTALVVLGNDLFRRAPEERVAALLERVPTVVVDHLRHRTADAAEVILPDAPFSEGNGTVVSSEGRAQRFFQAHAPGDGEVRDGWRWLDRLATAAGEGEGWLWARQEAVAAELAEELPVFAPVAEMASAAMAAVGSTAGGRKLPRSPHRASGRTARHADRDVREPRPPEDPDSPFAFSMEGSRRIPASLRPYYRAPGWSSVQALNKFQDEVGGPLRDGEAGRRLIEPAADAADAPYLPLPGDPTAGSGADDELTVIALPHVFAEELSSRSGRRRSEP